MRVRMAKEIRKGLMKKKKKVSSLESYIGIPCIVPIDIEEGHHQKTLDKCLKCVPFFMDIRIRSWIILLFGNVKL